ncbi:MAG: hypothetical protein ABIJ92_03040 [Candidatus Aenigmatarchaeota archaeon]
MKRETENYLKKSCQRMTMGKKRGSFIDSKDLLSGRVNTRTAG